MPFLELMFRLAVAKEQNSAEAILRIVLAYSVIYGLSNIQYSRQKGAPKNCSVQEGFIDQSEEEQGSYTGHLLTGAKGSLELG